MGIMLGWVGVAAKLVTPMGDDPLGERAMSVGGVAIGVPRDMEEEDCTFD
jgi:hypothetical protein